MLNQCKQEIYYYENSIPIEKRFVLKNFLSISAIALLSGYGAIEYAYTGLLGLNFADTIVSVLELLLFFISLPELASQAVTYIYDNDPFISKKVKIIDIEKSKMSLSELNASSEGLDSFLNAYKIKKILISSMDNSSYGYIVEYQMANQAQPSKIWYL